MAGNLTSPPVGMLRRNGKPSSCEPCRRSKLRCDNGSPSCRRCERRKIKDKCFYHPAPLTQPRKASEQLRGSLRPIRPSLTSPVSHGHHIPTESFPEPARCPITPSSVRTPTHLTPPRSTNDSQSPPNPLPSLDITHCAVGPDLIRRLESIAIFESLCSEFYSTINSSSIIGPILLKAIEVVRVDLEQALRYKTRSEIAAQVSENTRKPFQIPATTTAADFHTLFTGENLRWEMIGLIFAMSGLCIYLIPQNVSAVILEKCTLPQSPDFSAFSAAQIASSNHCIMLTQECRSMSDVSLWMLYMDSLLHANHYGDSHPLVWRRLGEVSTEIFALGLHQDPEEPSKTPFFLSEARKRVFCAIYKSDKLLAGFLNRPPRIPRQFCSIRIPLDLSNEEIMLEGPALGAALASLDEDGWNTGGHFHPTSWQRVRYKMSMFREELLELSYLSSGQDTTERLSAIDASLQSTWEALPPHLRYTENCWKLQDVRTCVMLICSSLDYYHCLFVTRRLLAQQVPSSQMSLLKTSMELLSLVIELTKQRLNLDLDAIEINRDLPWVLLYFGLPAAGVLVAELRSRTHGKTEFPSFISRAVLVRNLCVLVSTLDWMDVPSYRYRDLCASASKKLGAEVDEVINLVVCPQASQTQNSHEMQDFPGTEQAPLNQDTVHPLEDMHNDETFMNWLDNVDWNTTMPTF